MIENMKIEEAIDLVKADLNIRYDLKAEQLSAIKDICDGKNIFTVLPTGFGKSEIFMLPPLIMDKVGTSIYR